MKITKIYEDPKFNIAVPTIKFGNPDFIYLPLKNGRCPEAELYIKEGDHVKLGEIIGLRKGGFFEQPIHSTVSGDFVGIKKMFHRTGKLVECIKIKNDFQNEKHSSIKPRTDEEVLNLEKDEFIEIVKNRGLVGLGGSGFPTYIKFQTDKKINNVFINGIECEPYLRSDVRTMLEYPTRIVKALNFSMNFFGAKNGYIVIKRKYKDVYSVLNQVILRLDLQDKIQVYRVEDYYPAGWEISMYKDVLGIKIKPGVLPVEYGVFGLNASTMLGLYRALKHDMPVTKRHFTISGDGIKFPTNFRVVVGTTISELIELCGGYTPGEKTLIIGGPMMGASLVRDNVVISKTSTSILVFNKNREKEETCIRCMSCTYSCPVKIQPVQIHNAVKQKNKSKADTFGIDKCILCGMCSYVCTSKIHLTDYMRKAKKMK